MKKTYETPVAEKIEFCYEDQIVASSSLGPGCVYQWSNLVPFSTEKYWK